MTGKLFTGFRVIICACIIAFEAARVDAIVDFSLSDCLTEPLKGLIYQYTGIVEGLNGVKTGCYVMYGDGTLHYDQLPHPSDPVTYRQYFVIDETGSEIPVSSDGRLNISISSSCHSTGRLEHKAITYELDEICFPRICYDSWSEYSWSCHIPVSECGPERRTLGIVDTYDSELFCSAGNTKEIIAFRPHDASVTIPGKVPVNLEPYLRYIYFAETPEKITFGCEISRPLNSDIAFRNFMYFDDKGNEISVNKDGTLINKPSDMVGLVGATNLCFPTNCYSSDEDQQCESTIKRAFPESGYGIQLLEKNKKITRLLIRLRKQCK